MLTLPSKLLFALTGLAAAAAVGIGAATGERAGVLLLAGLAIAAFVLGLASLAIDDRAPFVAPDAPAPDAQATTPGAPARGSAWPLLAALAVGVMAVGAAAEAAFVYAGLGLGVVAGFGWFARSWSDHPLWTPRVRERVDYRLLLPLGLPVGMIVLTAVIAVSFSRVLLAIDKEVATFIAIVVAAGLLAVFALIASRPSVGPSMLVVLAALGGISVIGAGIAGAAQGERHFEHHGEHHEPLEVTAEEVAFEEDELVASSEEEHVTLHFRNLDEGIFHNVALYEGTDEDAVPVWNGVGFPGRETRTYTFDTPEPGTYTFVCDFHVNMRGQFIVE